MSDDINFALVLFVGAVGAMILGLSAIILVLIGSYIWGLGLAIAGLVTAIITWVIIINNHQDFFDDVFGGSDE